MPALQRQDSSGRDSTPTATCDPSISDPQTPGAQHTAGDWRIERSGDGTLCVVAGYARSICDIIGSMPVDEANARLIAAAPKLLDRLQDIIARAHTVLAFAYSDIPEGSAIPEQLTNLEHALRFAGAAVAKATGAA